MLLMFSFWSVIASHDTAASVVCYLNYQRVVRWFWLYTGLELRGDGIPLVEKNDKKHALCKTTNPFGLLILCIK